MAFQEQRFDFHQLSHQQTEQILQEHQIALTIDEILTVQNLLQRPPTLTECILWSIQGSEHCSYKSTRSHLKSLPTEAPNVILGPKEDAGIVAVATDNSGKRYGVVMSHESHNHPSQVVPYEGAATGIGGNVRDVCCMGAEVIGIANSLRFGSIDNPRTHWLHEGVVSGIAGYGNPLGLPTIGGDLYYDAAYQQNCLVTAVTLGIVREDQIIHSYVPEAAAGYDLILVGKPTDRSGFGGASFASLELDTDKQEQNRSAVQEPNAFLGRHLLTAHYELFKQLNEMGLSQHVGFKDLGAGGVACASVELVDGAGLGADVYLEQVPVSEPNLHPAVILCSETQERYLWAVPPELTSMILKHYNETYDLPKVSQGACARVVGKVRDDQQFVVHYQTTQLVHAKASDITQGLQYDRPYHPAEQSLQEPQLPEQDPAQTLLKLLQHENIASRQPVFEHYDKQVQGRTQIEAGHSDAGILQPFNSSEYPTEIQQTGIALSVDHNPRYGKIDAYWCAVNAVIESMRNVAATGATPQAITDCLCFGNPEKPEPMYDLVQAIRGIKNTLDHIPLKAHPASPTPVIGGNVSLYNESAGQAIPASPVISCLGKLNDVKQALTQHFKQTDSIILMVGKRRDECGGSVYYALHHELGKQLPKPDFDQVKGELYAITDAAEQGLLLSAHDISDGGIAVALAEMSFANEVGFNVTIPGELPLDKLLFSETGGFVLEVSSTNRGAVQETFAKHGITTYHLGTTHQHPTLHFNNEVTLALPTAKQAWQSGLREKLQ